MKGDRMWTCKKGRTSVYLKCQGHKKLYTAASHLFQLHPYIYQAISPLIPWVLKEVHYNVCLCHSLEEIFSIAVITTPTRISLRTNDVYFSPEEAWNIGSITPSSARARDSFQRRRWRRWRCKKMLIAQWLFTRDKQRASSLTSDSLRLTTRVVRKRRGKRFFWGSSIKATLGCLCCVGPTPPRARETLFWHGWNASIVRRLSRQLPRGG